MIWIITTCIFFLLIIILSLYIRFLLSQLRFLVENKIDLLNALQDFCSHIKVLHENRLFFGDPMFIRLMKHGNKLISYLKSYEEVYGMLEEDYEYDESEEEDEIYSYEKN
jgi:hypothetical protein